MLRQHNTAITALPVLDHLDTTTQAREHLEHSEALFLSILKLLKDVPDFEPVKHLARLGCLTSGQAADDMHNQAQVLEAQEVHS